MLYTIIPIQVVMQEKTDHANYEDRLVQGVTCTVEKIEQNQFRLVRVWSTDPNIFLHPDFQPGKVVKL